MASQELRELQAIAKRYGVAKLELFGSATSEAFDKETSDIDILVEFFPEADLGPWLSKFFQLKDELESLFGRPVDLLETQAIQNPWLRREIEKQRVVLYAA
ncbi:MAG: nucleotidyltransferase domain-containing protein [Candidatus Hydrogenedentes bacterium]|nr:nucleotidyltransferase domain-containing protein [Candidatus Hydrogenedentota bacterium]